MFNVFKLKEDLYCVVTTHGDTTEFNEVELIKWLLWAEVKEEDIIEGLKALMEDDVAEYGINRTFMFSRKIAA